ncbi:MULTISPECIES: hypothetical protein [unclassified Phyllobacterium]|uniref:hypothetical protein n=1 Tax=unclassified Phyllobacterium TaxID=2638441 RepID=UPI0030130F44
MSTYFPDALDLFRNGYDTVDIARMTGRRESDVLCEITKLRSQCLGKANPYPVRFPPTNAALIKRRQAGAA